MEYEKDDPRSECIVVKYVWPLAVTLTVMSCVIRILTSRRFTLKYTNGPAALATILDPQTKAYHEIWLDGEKVVDSQDGVVQEPIYGQVYLPRKFKIGIAVPPSNDVDVFSQDLGFIAIVEDGRLKGFNVSVGGGMGMSHGDPLTYPQVAQVIGFITPDQLIDLAEKTVTIQRDYGDRSVRKHARFKYTIDDRGIDWFVGELTARLGWKLEAARPYHFDHNGDRYGWVKGSNGKWHFNLVY